MDPQVRTSFIPKRPISATPIARRSSSVSIFFFLALIIFLGSILLGGGAFAYKRYLDRSIASKSDQLARARAAFEPATIKDLLRLDDRLTYSKQILDMHAAPSTLFSLLSQSTLATVSFNKFEYSRGQDGKGRISLAGTTGTFSDVALQSDEFNKIRSFKNVIFSNFTVKDDNAVDFSVDADVDANSTLYRTMLAGAAAAAPESPVQ